jgi:hypothetical protein
MNNSKKDSNTTDPGYPVYPPEEDIYAKAKEASDIDPENLTAKKAPNEIPGKPNEKGFRDDMTGEDLDVPGNDDDEAPSGSGKSEDEENNYYSLGGDDHNDLEQDNA